MAITSLREVLLVNALDHAGGAEASVRAVLDGFEELGTRTRLAVGIKRGADPRVIALERRGRSGRRVATASGAARRRLIRAAGIEDFDHPASHRLLELAGSRPDLVMLFNLHGGYFDLRLLPQLSARLPVVASVRDSWLFTGHCAVPMACERWRFGCGRCPDLAIPPAVVRDSTDLNWRRKRRILAASRLAVTTPSRWQMDRIRESLMAPAITASRVIPNGVNLDVFTPGPRGPSREALDIERDADVLLFVAHGGRVNPFKDIKTLTGAVRRLAARPRERRLDLIVVGHSAPDQLFGPRVRIRHLAACDDPLRLAHHYRAADLYVHAAVEETFCNAAAEALACGTPVVAAAGGGIREVVEDQRNGLSLPPGRPDLLADAIAGLLADDSRRVAMGASAAADARERFDRSRRIAELHAWCSEVAGRWTRAA